MKLVFVSNILNHHQKTLCSEFQKHFEGFRFISTENSSGIGYQKLVTADYVVPYYLPEGKKEAESEITAADVVIFGSCPNALIEMRMKENKLSFLYSERFFKKSTLQKFIPHSRNSVIARVGKYAEEEMYVLCASAFTSADLKAVGFPENKCFKWGYFPETESYENTDYLISAKKRRSMLWAGRFLDWKHPDDAVRLCKKLRNSGYDFELNIIGAGETENKLRKMIDRYKLTDRVHMLGSMTPRQVRGYMERSQIYLFTSDRNEGWGAVLNEAMNSGCAVAASHAIGAVPFLLEDNKNGVIYKSGNIADLFGKVKLLLDNDNFCRACGKNAYETITKSWDAKTAAENFKTLAENILNGETAAALQGPCSPAKIICDNWYNC